MGISQKDRPSGNRDSRDIEELEGDYGGPHKGNHPEKCPCKGHRIYLNCQRRFLDKGCP